MLRWIERIRQKRQERDALIKMVALLQEDEGAMLDQLGRQFDARLQKMTPEEHKQALMSFRSLHSGES